MERHGFIRDMMDVKVLILLVAARLQTAVTVQEIYELCYQDDKLTYFDVCDAVPDLVASGHLETKDQKHYTITPLGREHGELTEESVAYPVRERAKQAVESFNREARRSKFIHAGVEQRESGEYAAKLEIKDAQGWILRLELMAPNQPRAAFVSRCLHKNAEVILDILTKDMIEDGEGA